MSVDVSADLVIRKGKNRILPGFELENNSSWKQPFFFIQAADTQLGLIANYGDGSIADQVSIALCMKYWTFRIVTIRSSDPRSQFLISHFNNKLHFCDQYGNNKCGKLAVTLHVRLDKVEK